MYTSKFTHADVAFSTFEIDPDLINASKFELGSIAMATKKESITFIPAFDDPKVVDPTNSLVDTHALLESVSTILGDAHISFIRYVPPLTLQPEDSTYFLGNLHHDWKYVGARMGKGRNWIDRGNYFDPSPQGDPNQYYLKRGVLNLGEQPRTIQIVDVPRSRFDIDTDAIRPTSKTVEISEVQSGEGILAPYMRVVHIPERVGPTVTAMHFNAGNYLHAGATKRSIGHFMIATARWSATVFPAA